MVEHWRVLLEGIVAHPETPVGELPLLTPAEHQRLLVQWNDTAADYPREQCVHQLFEQQAARSPDATAVVFGEYTLSYAELNARANQWAHYLRSKGVGPDVLVGLCLERSLELVVGMLGILKAGGAYLPLDPSYPTERLAFMLADAAASVVLTQQSLRDTLPPTAAARSASTPRRRNCSSNRPTTPSPSPAQSISPTSSTPPAPPDSRKGWRYPIATSRGWCWAPIMPTLGATRPFYC